MKYLLWLLKAAIFFTLFAFALNNQQIVTVHFFFGTSWRAPLVLVVLAASVLGLIAGMLVMTPRWWKQRSAAAKLSQPAVAKAEQPASAPHPSDLIPPTIHGI